MIIEFKLYEDYLSDVYLRNITDRGIVNMYIDGEIYILLYHGTNRENSKKILRTGKFKNGTWFSPDIDIARRYSLMTGSKTPVIFNMYIKLDSLYISGDYFIAKHDLHNDKHGQSIYE